ncbi:DUF1631 family protein [Roseateles cellulosilyticus]|uniref:DUF1631 domain-containing protein n=1 Tax=Pelomonas cellulosilytica TaxID=2906762 RepID=A0ABS8XV26_9BURK|nr:DUF1631 family protein [Pelomonas sp. P8]MCE4555607.1 DUF1631 domain-containing protein [Pelomonas sp. P8]
MEAHPQFDRHVRFLESQALPFATGWVEAMLEAMREPADVLPASVDRRQLRVLLGMVEPLRMHIGECLAGHLLQGFRGAEARALGRGTKATLSGFDIDELTLVVESQAEKDIEISRVVQLADLKLEWELRELQGLAATMLPGVPWGEDPTACGPAVFARAVSQTVYEQTLEPEQQSVWMRVAAPTLVTQLRPLLAALTQQLQAAGLQSPRYRTILAPNSSAVLKAGTSAAAPAEAALAAIPPEQLQALLRSLPLLQRGLAAGGPRPALPTLPRSDGEAEFRLEGLDVAPAPEVANVSHVLLGRLFERLLADPQLAPALRGSIAQLEAPVRELAARDAGVLSSEQHPAWALINKIAGHSGSLPAHDAERNEAFQRFVDPLVARLSQGGPGQPEAYAQALDEVQTFIDDERQQQIDRARPAMDALGQLEAERRLLPLLRDQVETQLGKAREVSPTVQTFLRGPWIEVLAKVMATEGAESPEAQALVGTVDELLASLQRPGTPAERADLRRRLPSLIGRVQQGMALIDLPQQHRHRVLAELMQTHRRQLAEQADPPAPVPAATVPAPEPEPSPETEPSPLDDWHAHDTHVGTLPTVPMGLDGGDPANDWLDALRPGQRCKLHLQGVWATASLAWVSDNGAFFVFTSNLAGGMHSMTRRALKRLRSEGLATDVAEVSPVQRALGGLLQELTAPMPLN